MNELKRCTGCGEEKPLSQYSAMRATKDGRKPQCKACSSASYKKWKAESGWRPKNSKEYMVEYRKKNQSRIAAYNREYGKANKRNLKGYMREWAKLNRAKVAAKSANDRAAKLLRTVSWSDREAIDYIYFAAGVVAENFGGTKPVVDHIIPLKGELVSGLHVASNMQLLSATQNGEKGNKFVPQSI